MSACTHDPRPESAAVCHDSKPDSVTLHVRCGWRYGFISPRFPKLFSFIFLIRRRCYSHQSDASERSTFVGRRTASTLPLLSCSLDSILYIDMEVLMRTRLQGQFPPHDVRTGTSNMQLNFFKILFPFSVGDGHRTADRLLG